MKAGSPGPPRTAEVAAACIKAMMHPLDHSDPTEVDDFFRRGEEYSLAPHSLVPPMGVDIVVSPPDLEGTDLPLRSPEQVARRARYIRLVSATMGTLVAGLVLVFANQAFALRGAPAHESLPSAGALPPLRVSKAMQPAPEQFPPKSELGKSELGKSELGKSELGKASDSVASVADAVSNSAPKNEPLEARSPVAVVASANADAPNRASLTPQVTPQVTKAKPKGADQSVQVSNAKPAPQRLSPRVVKAKSPSSRAKLTAQSVVSPVAEKVSAPTNKPSNYKPPTASFSD